MSQNIVLEIFQIMGWSTNKLFWKQYFIFSFVIPICWNQKLPTINFSFIEENNITTSKILDTTTEFIQATTACEENVTCLQNATFPIIPIGIKTTLKPANKTTLSPFPINLTETLKHKHIHNLNINEKEICICNLKVIIQEKQSSKRALAKIGYLCLKLIPNT